MFLIILMVLLSKAELTVTDEEAFCAVEYYGSLQRTHLQ